MRNAIDNECIINCKYAKALSRAVTRCHALSAASCIQMYIHIISIYLIRALLTRNQSPRSSNREANKSVCNPMQT